MRLLALSLLLVPCMASAHGDAPSLEAEVGGYLIDIGYEPALSAGTPVKFDFDAFRVGPPIEYAHFASVDVRLTRNGAEIAAASVENDAVNVPTFTATFPEPGGYDMDVRYLDASGTLIVARTFHLEVPGAARAMVRDGLRTFHYALAAGLFALSAGIGGYALWERFTKKKA